MQGDLDLGDSIDVDSDPQEVGPQDGDHVVPADEAKRTIGFE